LRDLPGVKKAELSDKISIFTEASFIPILKRLIDYLLTRRTREFTLSLSLAVVDRCGSLQYRFFPNRNSPSACLDNDVPDDPVYS
jgi:hypothetical protein